MMYNKPIAALFDFDGVVVDTESQYSIFWNQIGREFHPEVENFGSRIKGQTLVQIYDTWFSGMTDIQSSITVRLNTYEAEMKYDYIPGVKDFMNTLRANDIRIAIVTSSNLKKMEQVFRKLPELKDNVDRILTSEDFSSSKPDPECFLLGSKIFSAPVENCVVFEDSFHGLTAGKAAGMKVVGLSTTNAAETIQDKCDCVIPDFRGFTLSDFLTLIR